MALKIGVFEVVAKIALQYFHERVWTKVTFGLQAVSKGLSNMNQKDLDQLNIASTKLHLLKKF